MNSPSLTILSSVVHTPIAYAVVEKAKEKYFYAYVIFTICSNLISITFHSINVRPTSIFNPGIGYSKLYIADSCAIHISPDHLPATVPSGTQGAV